MDLSIVIPCLDAARVLPAQLDALAEERPAIAWEVIVVDNGSDDDTAAMATSYTDRVPCLRVDAEQRRGRHHACNRGAEIARGANLVFVDADDVIEPGYISAMHDALQTAEIVAGRLIHRDPQGNELTEFGRVQTDDLMPSFGFKPYASGANLGVSRAVFLAVGGFADDIPFGEDVDLSWRLLAAGHRITFATDAAVIYNQRASLRSMFRQHRRFGRAQALLYRKYRHEGMPRRALRAAAADWGRSVRALPHLRDPGVRARFVRRLARNVGRIQGSLAARVRYL